MSELEGNIVVHDDGTVYNITKHYLEEDELQLESENKTTAITLNDVQFGPYEIQETG
jgi:hypothetical protein